MWKRINNAHNRHFRSLRTLLAYGQAQCQWANVARIIQCGACEKGKRFAFERPVWFSLLCFVFFHCCCCCSSIDCQWVAGLALSLSLCLHFVILCISINTFRSVTAYGSFACHMRSIQCEITSNSHQLFELFGSHLFLLKQIAAHFNVECSVRSSCICTMGEWLRFLSSSATMRKFSSDKRLNSCPSSPYQTKRFEIRCTCIDSKILMFLWHSQRHILGNRTSWEGGENDEEEIWCVFSLHKFYEILLFISLGSVYQVCRSPLTIEADSDVSLLMYADVLVICKAHIFFSSRRMQKWWINCITWKSNACMCRMSMQDRTPPQKLLAVVANGVTGVRPRYGIRRWQQRQQQSIISVQYGWAGKCQHEHINPISWTWFFSPAWIYISTTIAYRVPFEFLLYFTVRTNWRTQPQKT